MPPFRWQRRYSLLLKAMERAVFIVDSAVTNVEGKIAIQVEVLRARSIDRIPE